MSESLKDILRFIKRSISYNIKCNIEKDNSINEFEHLENEKKNIFNANTNT